MKRKKIGRRVICAHFRVTDLSKKARYFTTCVSAVDELLFGLGSGLTA